MSKQLPARPNLDHLRKQAKSLLAELKASDAGAVSAFRDHLPAARGLTPAKIRSAGFRLADAQSVVARELGFDSWVALSRHVEAINALQGEWRFVSLQVDGSDVASEFLTSSRLLLDGSRFRMESPDGNYDGDFKIDAETEPKRIDIAFVEGPEEGNTSMGIFEISGDQLTMCIGVVGAGRPAAFKSSKGTGHALERLRRVSAARQARVTGGTPRQTVAKTSPPAETIDPDAFDQPMTPLLDRLQGEWAAVSLVRDGEETKKEWLPFGSRITTGNETKVVFGGQVMVHARMRIDEDTAPIAVDYLALAGNHKGGVSFGIMDWVGDEVRFAMALPGRPRPASFAPGKGVTVSQWRTK